MKSHACFRVSVDDVAQDFCKYAELAKTRTFEIYDKGKVEIMLVRIEAVPDWHRQLQINVPTELMRDEELAAMRTDLARLKQRVGENGDRWPDEEE